MLFSRSSWLEISCLAVQNQFYDHIYQFKLKDAIKDLLDLRKRHRINAVSRVNIQKAEGDIYVAKIDNRVVIKLGPRWFIFFFYMYFFQSRHFSERNGQSSSGLDRMRYQEIWHLTVYLVQIWYGHPASWKRFVENDPDWAWFCYLGKHCAVARHPCASSASSGWGPRPSPDLPPNSTCPYNQQNVWSDQKENSWGVSWACR